ncbi:kinase-like domain-containing protein [Syncephalis fuscata]|nr:kinase-like domain-containing protein [Syncephalis fuscata]
MAYWPTSALYSTFDAWEQKGHLYLQTELCSRGTLKDYLDIHCNSEQIDEAQIWLFFADIAMGVKHLHDLNILHLDLKPANVFLDDEDRLKIGDFGMAAFHPTNGSDEREGDREYMAPEILNGQYDRPADIFSLGLIVLEMAINVVMPDNGVAWQKLRSNDFSDCDFSNVSDNLASCIRRLLAATPSERPTIDKVLQEPELRRLIETRVL